MEKERKKRKKGLKIRHIVLVALVAASAVMLLTTYVLSVVKVDGNAMAPFLRKGDIVVTIRQQEIERGDAVAFYHGNQVLIRRCVGVQGDWIRISEEGQVSINDADLYEEYASHKQLGQSDIEYPYQVPAKRYFVLADDREVMTDSRVAVVGSVSEKQMLGKIAVRIWPLNRVGKIA